MLTEIPFTQYMRPSGRAVEVSIVRPAEIMQLAEKIISDGLRFECEHLSSGHVSLTITSDDEDVAIKLCDNAPGKVGEAVDDLIRKYSRKSQ